MTRYGYFAVWDPQVGMYFERGYLRGTGLEGASFDGPCYKKTMQATKIVFLGGDGAIVVLKDQPPGIVDVAR